MRQFFATASLCQKIAKIRNYIILSKKIYQHDNRKNCYFAKKQPSEKKGRFIRIFNA